MTLANARIVSPGFEIQRGWIELSAGVIRGIGEGKHFSKDATDLDGASVLPGFIDLHAHGADGADVCDCSAASLDRIAQRKLQEGVTTWLPTTLTLAADHLREVFQTVKRWADSAPLNIPGIHLEGPWLNPLRAGAQNQKFIRKPDIEELKRLHAIFPIAILSLAPEIPGALEMIREARTMGIICSAAHTAADFSTIKEAQEAGLAHLTHFGNAMTGLHHREIGVVGAGFLDAKLRLELIADGVHLSDEMLRLILKVVEPDRLMLVTDSTAASWQSDGVSELGGLKVKIRDSIARLEDGSLAGSTLKFPQGLRRVATLSRRPLKDLIAITSKNQTESMGLQDRGSLETGQKADLVVIDDHYEVQQTFVAGKAS